VSGHYTYTYTNHLFPTTDIPDPIVFVFLIFLVIWWAGSWGSKRRPDEEEERDD